MAYAADAGQPAPTLPQGNKSVVTPTADGLGIRKAYNENGDPHAKYAREVCFYRHYGDSPLIPDLLDCLPQEPAIVMTKAPGAPCSAIRLSASERCRLSEDYAQKVMDLLSVEGDMNALKGRPFLDVGAQDLRADVLAALDRYPTDSRPSERILHRLRGAAQEIFISKEMLIKLDWNASNVFINDGAISQFIDFEQACIGTSEMLAGILLHNPFWHARSVFEVLQRRGFLSQPVASMATWVHFSFAAVLADSHARTGTAWDTSRLQSAYQRHVTDRLIELGLET
ncbi:MAG: hypothetical protein F4Y26_05665 [Gammaproteobacteria bacterium]|nr:hypothetical protein [Gammaproteobacteria bacterium]